MAPQAETNRSRGHSSCRPTGVRGHRAGHHAHRHRSSHRDRVRDLRDPGDPAVLLVMGFGTQLLGWDADFCRMLAARGRYVIRYDNRDCGLSTKLDEHPVDLGDFITAVTSGDFDRALAMAPYSLRDMAARRHRPARRSSASTAPTWSAPRWAA